MYLDLPVLTYLPTDPPSRSRLVLYMAIRDLDLPIDLYLPAYASAWAAYYPLLLPLTSSLCPAPRCVPRPGVCHLVELWLETSTGFGGAEEEEDAVAGCRSGVWCFATPAQLEHGDAVKVALKIAPIAPGADPRTLDPRDLLRGCSLQWAFDGPPPSQRTSSP